MARKALIISNPGETGDEHYCEGVNRDIENYMSFLTSSIGGAWEIEEIRKLPRPSVAEVRTAMAAITLADYSLVIFCGHGGMYHLNGPTMLELRSGQTLNADELRGSTSKRTVILDCCREIQRPIVLAKRAVALDEALAAIRISRSECREYYDRWIESCPRGLITLFGCSADERAGDDATRGGFYSSSLIDSATTWAGQVRIDTRTDCKVLSVVNAHNDTIDTVERLSGGTQHPTIQKPRSGNYFPFGVVA